MTIDLSDDMKQKLDLAMKAINKEYGPGSLMQPGNEPPAKWPAITTGAPTLDNALGIGGLPFGRVVEIYGPESSGKSTLAMSVVAEAQNQGMLCAYVDAESALDPKYAIDIGMDWENILLSQPDSGEEALNITEDIIKTGLVKVVVVDSVAALTPLVEMEGSFNDQQMGQLPRMMSKAMRKLVPLVREFGVCLIFINQIREKIGVMFGCFNYSARVVLADGTTEKIGKIVNQQMDVDVLSYNPETGKVEPRRIVDWHDNGLTDMFLQFEVAKGYGQGTSKFGVTPNHMIFTPHGEVPAGKLNVGDEVLSRVANDRKFTDDQWQIIYGSLLGDGSISTSGSKGRIRIGHGPKQSDYLEWKASILGLSTHRSNLGRESAVNSTDLMRFAGMQSRKTTKCSIPLDLIETMDERAFAIWYMDDGTLSGSHARWGAGKATISIKATDEESRNNLAERSMKLGLGNPFVSDRGLLVWSGQEARSFFEGIGRYIPPSMRHKMPDYAPDYDWSPDDRVTHEDIVLTQRINKIYVKPETGCMNKFDLTVEGNHTYLVDDVIVHNSPETQPGGRALKFAATQRIDVRRDGDFLKSKDGEVIGFRVKAKVIKNKLGPPFKMAGYDLIYGKGIDKVGCVLDMALMAGIFTQSGSFYKYQDETFAQGRANAVEKLEADTNLLKIIKDTLDAQ